MPSRRAQRPGHSKPWRGKPRMHLLAALAGVLPLYSSLVTQQLAMSKPQSIQGFVFYLAVISPLAIMIALLLLKVLCGETPKDLNLKPGKLSSDLLAALLLSPVIILANVVSSRFLSELFPGSAANTSVQNLFVELAANPMLLALFVGLLIPLGAASEEVIRVFLLSRLWKVWPSTPARLTAAAISAVLFGLIHLYRGPSGVVWAAIFGLIMALYYFRYGRVAPLILAHYVTNTLQVAIFVLAAS